MTSAQDDPGTQSPAITHDPVRVAEVALRDSERRFRLLVEAVKDYAIFMLSPEGVIASWNEGAHRIKGYTADEIIGKHMSIFYPPEDVAAPKVARAGDRGAHGIVRRGRLARTEGRQPVLGQCPDLRHPP